VTGQTTRYATPVLRKFRGRWIVHAAPWATSLPSLVGVVTECASGWTAMTHECVYAGLWPTKQAAAEVLVKQAGYELEMG
jgi:hypothetical protein